MIQSQQSPQDDDDTTNDQSVDNTTLDDNAPPSEPNPNKATEIPKEQPITILDGHRDHEDPIENEDLSRRDISDKPINYAIDSVEEEFRPSKFQRLAQYVLDETKRHFNIDPLGEDYIMIIATSADKGQSFKVVADSTEDQHYIGQDVWAKKMVEKEVMQMKLNQDDIIKQAKEILKQEEAGQR